METFIIKAFQLILALSILVIIHEFGHYIFARMFGMKVDRFYLFFNPGFSLFKYYPNKGEIQLIAWTKKEGEGKNEKEIPHALATLKVGKKYSPVKKNGKPSWAATCYGIGWLPLGGYCSINGMVDETTTVEQLAEEAKPYEFRSKPAWQRLLVMAAGVLFNFLLAILIYAGIVYAMGEKYVPFEKAELGMAYSPEAKKVGFRDGDIPFTVDGKPIANPAQARLQMAEGKIVEVKRNGATAKVTIPENFIFRLDEEMKSGQTDINFLTYRMPVEISQIQAGGGADHADMKVGDRIIAIDSVQTPSLDVFFPALANHGDETVRLTIVRPNQANGDTLHTDVKLSADSKMGIGLQTDPSAFFDYQEKHYNLLQSVPRGAEVGYNQLASYASSMKKVFTKEGAKSVGGFGTLGSIFPEKWNWVAFWNIAAFISVALAFMNILPIPGLDGGHILFLLIEAITGRKVPEKVQEVAIMIGFGLLLVLLLYANAMDVVRLFGL